MNTFIVDSDPKICALILDNKRLGKQRVECCQLLRAMERTSGGWIHHPATLMWKSHVSALKYYTNCMIEEWCKRGFKNTIPFFDVEVQEMPPWMHWHQLQKSHQASLLRKDFAYYSKYWNNLGEYMEYKYVWPTKLTIPIDAHTPIQDMAERI